MNWQDTIKDLIILKRKKSEAVALTTRSPLQKLHFCPS